jgi:hypothetical protein
VFASAAQDIVDRLLFRNAAPLPDGVVGDEAFRKSFAQNALRSPAGHALRDFQLRDRIFANRCSFLIYSEAFRALPETLKDRVFERLWAALHRRDPRYAYLDTGETRRIYEILLATQPDATLRWQKTDRVSAVAPSL